MRRMAKTEHGNPIGAKLDLRAHSPPARSRVAEGGEADDLQPQGRIRIDRRRHRRRLQQAGGRLDRRNRRRIVDRIRLLGSTDGRRAAQ